MAGYVPDKPGVTLINAYVQSNDLQNLIITNADAKRIWDIAVKWEGLKTNCSQHACGYLIVDKAITDYLPQCRLKNPNTDQMELVTQLEAPTCEDRGLLKMDFLGLRTLGVVHETINSIKATTGKDIHYEDIPIDDVKVYEFLSEGNTSATFQLESNLFTGMVTKGLSDIKYKVINAEGNQEKLHEIGMIGFNRLADMNALGRPGPLQYVPQYCENILDESKITYDLEEVKPILQKTYGIILYQEQVMQIVRVLAGFSAGQSDTIRKAMGKKKKEIVEEYGDYFIHGNKKMGIKGCVANGVDEEKAKVLWATMAKFSEYAFNKSHAVAYSINSIRTAWLMYYYPCEYMCAVLNSYIDNSDKMQQYLYIAKLKGLNLLPPSLNRSNAMFSIENGAIRHALSSLKGVGEIGSTIIEERNEKGQFTSFSNFLYRMTKYHTMNKGALTALTCSGLFDEFHYTRKNLIKQMETMTDYVKSIRVIAKKNYSIFDAYTMNDNSIKEGPFLQIQLKKSDDEYDNFRKLLLEKQYASAYISGHPLDEFSADGLEKGKNIMDIIDNADNIKGKVTVYGLFATVEQRISKNGRTFYSGTLEDRTGTVNFMYFPTEEANKVDDNIVYIKENEPVKIYGTISVNDYGTTLMIKKVSTLRSVKIAKVAANQNLCLLTLPIGDNGQPQLSLITQMPFNKGTQKIFFKDDFDHPLKENIAITASTYREIEAKVGSSNIMLM